MQCTVLIDNGALFVYNYGRAVLHSDRTRSIPTTVDRGAGWTAVAVDMMRLLNTGVSIIRKRTANHWLID